MGNLYFFEVLLWENDDLMHHLCHEDNVDEYGVNPLYNMHPFGTNYIVYIIYWLWIHISIKVKNIIN